jgi:hypothetical protein
MPRKLLFVGGLQIFGFIVGFIVLVPLLSTVGAAISILLSYTLSCIPALIWSEKILLRYLLNAVIAVLGGVAISDFIDILMPEGVISDITLALTSVIVSLIIVFVLKNTSVQEVRTLIKTILKNTT